MELIMYFIYIKCPHYSVATTNSYIYDCDLFHVDEFKDKMVFIFVTFFFFLNNQNKKCGEIQEQKIKPNDHDGKITLEQEPSGVHKNVTKFPQIFIRKENINNTQNNTKKKAKDKVKNKKQEIKFQQKKRQKIIKRDN